MSCTQNVARTATIQRFHWVLRTPFRGDVLTWLVSSRGLLDGASVPLRPSLPQT